MVFMRAVISKATGGFILSGLLLLATVPVDADILNGSFETPVVTPGTFLLFSVGSALIPNWTVVGVGAQNVGIVSGTFTQNGVTFPAQSGSQWLDLTGLDSNSTEGVSQSVATIAGHLYQLSYFIGNTTGGGIFGTTSTVNVQLNGVQTFSDTNSAVNPTSLTWQEFTHTFTATGATTTLAFRNGDPASDNSNGLDNITLLDLGPAVTPVPEPATLLLLVFGAVSLGAVARRRW
jgi:hypothetical protein